MRISFGLVTPESLPETKRIDHKRCAFLDAASRRLTFRLIRQGAMGLKIKRSFGRWTGGKR